MSESKRQQIARTLVGLEKEDQAWVINFLVQHLASLPASDKRKAKKPHRDECNEAQWEEYFAGQPAVELPQETASLHDILTVTAGKTIKPIEKWL